MKIELSHGIDLDLIRFSLVALKVKFRTAGQRTACGEQKSHFHFSAPLL